MPLFRKRGSWPLKVRVRTDFIGVLLSGVIWGTLSPAGKRLGMLGTDMLYVGFLRALVMTVGVGLFLRVCCPGKFRVRPGQLARIFLVAGPCIVGIYAGFFFALQYLSIPVTIVIFFTHPLLTTAGSLFITRETPDRYQVAGALLTLAGVSVGVLMSGASLSGSLNPTGLAWVLFASISMSLYSLFGRLSAQTGFVPQTTLFFYIQASGLLWLAAVKSVVSGWEGSFVLSGQQILLISYVALIGSLVGYSLYFYSLRTVQASTASIVSSIEIVTAFVLSSILLGQPPLVNEIAGAALIVLAIVLVGRSTGIPEPERSIGIYPGKDFL